MHRDKRCSSPNACGCISVIRPLTIPACTTTRPVRDGVYREKRCALKPKKLDHAVLLVGWGTSAEGEDYWVVR